MFFVDEALKSWFLAMAAILMGWVGALENVLKVKDDAFVAVTLGNTLFNY